MKIIAPIVLSFLLQLSLPAEIEVNMANGIMIGSVTNDSAIVWTRLTENPERNRSGVEFLLKQELKHPEGPTDGLSQLPEGSSLRDIDASVPGVMGQVRLTYWLKSDATQKKSLDWTPVEADEDFIHQSRLDGLKSNEQYCLLVEGRASDAKTASVKLEGNFRTAPAATQSEKITFTVVTGSDYPRRDDKENGHIIYKTMLDQIKPDFFVHTGDVEYYDKPQPFAVTETLARYKWNRLMSMPNWRNFHKQVASYFIKDDHDTLKNDCWPGQTYGSLTWEQGLSLFKEQFPVGEQTHRTVRWGKDLQIWIVEGRDFRSANNIEDGPEKTIWGKEQKQWFFDTVKQSNATFRILISPTPIVGPDRGGKNDNHANKGFTHEGDEIRQFISSQPNMFVICGDRHWQYVSNDPDTKVKEFSCGPTSNKHAGGFSGKKKPIHDYIKIKGGFLEVIVDPENGTPSIAFRFHGVKGELYYEYKTNALK